MPSPHSRKIYVENGYYHVFNRGVEKRVIFEDSQDYKVFLSYIKEYLSLPPDPNQFLKELTFKGQAFKGVPRLPKNYNGEIELVAYCLMPNHFHFLIKQNSKFGLPSFMQSLLTRYSAYFNKKYDRVGSLFQGRYKAVMVKDDRQLLILSRYIHRNPLEITPDLEDAYSSYADYLGKRNTSWLKPKIVLDFFDKKTAPEFIKINSYKDFVEGKEAESFVLPESLTLD